MKRIKPEHEITSDDLDVPLIVNLGYNVHGNEPSSFEAALLTAYTLVASNHPEIEKYRNDMVVFIYHAPISYQVGLLKREKV